MHQNDLEEKCQFENYRSELMRISRLWQHLRKIFSEACTKVPVSRSKAIMITGHIKYVTQRTFFIKIAVVIRFGEIRSSHHLSTNDGGEILEDLCEEINDKKKVRQHTLNDLVEVRDTIINSKNCQKQ